MMLAFKWFGCAFLALGLGVGTAAAQADGDHPPADPQALVKWGADRVMSVVSEQRDDLKAHPEKIVPLMLDIVGENFDFPRITQTAAGLIWRKANEQQRQRLTEEFRTLLLRTYGTALLDFAGYQIEYPPTRAGQADADNVTVNTLVVGGGRPPVAVDYRLVNSDGRWRVYDVVIEQLSLVSNYRNTWLSIVRREGIDGLIKQLEQKNAQNNQSPA